MVNKIIWIVLFNLCTCVGSSLLAQENNNTFDKDISTFMEYTNAGNWDKVLDMTYPRLFNLVPRDTMKLIFQQAFDNGMKLTTDILEINKVYAPIKNEGEIFQRIDYLSTLNFEFGEADWENKEMIISGLQAQSGLTDLEADDALRSITMKTISTMIAIRQTADPTWKYLQYQESQEMMLGQIIPVKIIDQMFHN